MQFVFPWPFFLVIIVMTVRAGSFAMVAFVAKPSTVAAAFGSLLGRDLSHYLLFPEVPRLECSASSQ